MSARTVSASDEMPKVTPMKMPALKVFTFKRNDKVLVIAHLHFDTENGCCNNIHDRTQLSEAARSICKMQMTYASAAIKLISCKSTQGTGSTKSREQYEQKHDKECEQYPEKVLYLAALQTRVLNSRTSNNCNNAKTYCEKLCRSQRCTTPPCCAKLSASYAAQEW